MLTVELKDVEYTGVVFCISYGSAMKVRDGVGKIFNTESKLG